MAPFKMHFPQQYFTCSMSFFSKMEFFRHEMLALNTADAVPGVTSVGPSKLMSLVGLKLSLSMVLISPSWLRLP